MAELDGKRESLELEKAPLTAAPNSTNDYAEVESDKISKYGTLSK